MLIAQLQGANGVTPSRETPMDRPSLGPVPERPQFLQRPGNFNMRPDMGSASEEGLRALNVPRAPGGLANMFLQTMSPQGLEIPPREPQVVPSTMGPRSEAPVMSDESPDPVSAGQQYARSPSFQISPRPNGQYAVIDIRTGQVRFVGGLDGARNAQSSLIASSR